MEFGIRVVLVVKTRCTRGKSISGRIIRVTLIICKIETHRRIFDVFWIKICRISLKVTYLLKKIKLAAILQLNFMIMNMPSIFTTHLA